MKVLLCLFPQYADFEIAHLLFFLRKKGRAEIVAATADGKEVESLGGLVVRPVTSFGEAVSGGYGMILLPGGDGVREVMEDIGLLGLLKAAHGAGTPIAAICASSVFLAAAGILEDRSFTCMPNTHSQFADIFTGARYSGADVDASGNLITAKGTAFPQFTVAAGAMMGLWKDEAEAEWALQFCSGQV